MLSISEKAIKKLKEDLINSQGKFFRVVFQGIG